MVWHRSIADVCRVTQLCTHMHVQMQITSPHIASHGMASHHIGHGHRTVVGLQHHVCFPQ
jgi:hypothetical protein